MLEYDAQRDAEVNAGATERDAFSSIPATWYFIIASMTTVGYGDQYPITPMGKFVCSICMLMGIFVLGLPIVIIGHSFEEVFAIEDELKEKRKAIFAEKRSHNRRDGDPFSPRVPSADEMVNPLADGQPLGPSVDAGQLSAASRIVSVDKDQEVNAAGTDVSSKTGFEPDQAVLAMCEVLDELYDQTGDKRFQKAWSALAND